LWPGKRFGGLDVDAAALDVQTQPATLRLWARSALVAIELAAVSLLGILVGPGQLEAELDRGADRGRAAVVPGALGEVVEQQAGGALCAQGVAQRVKDRRGRGGVVLVAARPERPERVEDDE
jgi:hypothetical protein